MSKHGLSFSIEGADISVDEMGAWVAGMMRFPSEHVQELFAHDATHAILDGVTRKVFDVKQRESRAAWESRNPPNHAGFYYCHICGGWVHREQAELDHIVPTSVVEPGLDPDRDSNRRMAHAWAVWSPDGKKLICPGNHGKGSRQIPSKTLEIRPPDEEA